MKWTYILNPFAKIPEKSLMLIGVISFLLGCFVSWKFEMIFDGILDAHSYPNISYIDAFLSNSVNVIILCALLFALGKFINSKTRMIDILNTSFLYRIPIYIVAVLSGLPMQKDFEAKIMSNMSNLKNLELTSNEMVFLFFFSIVSLCFVAYSITIIVNGFRTATNAKKWQHFLSLAIAIIATEIISKLIINAL